MKKEDAIMDINHETAMSLWKKRYGKATRVSDFAGRMMDKGAYDNRNSEYGWNLDHILPRSLGGKDTESNLVCCHIKTNDEKADKFPVFIVNGKTFEIIKVENHYEIREKTPNEETNEEVKESSINFFDYSAGLDFFKKCQKGCFIITITIILKSLKDLAIIDFISEILSDYKIEVTKYNRVTFNDDFWGNVENYKLKVIIYDVQTKEETQSILNDCVLINTYLSKYFLPNKYISKYSIINNMYKVNSKFELEKFEENDNVNNDDKNRILINDLVKINTKANKENLKQYNKMWIYDYIYTNLGENLGKVNDK